MSRLLSALAVLAVASGASAADALRQQFAYAAPITTQQPAALYEFTLPASVYRDTVSPTLDDLRVLNAAGEQVPYALLPPPDPQTAQNWQALPLYALGVARTGGEEGWRLQVRGDAASIDLRRVVGSAPSGAPGAWLFDARALKRPLSGLRVSWPADTAEFSAQARVEVSDTLLDWHEVAVGQLVSLRHGSDSLQQQELRFAATEARFWRLTLGGTASPPQIEAAQGLSEQAQGAPARSEQHIALQPGSVAGEWLADLQMHAPVDRVTVLLPQANTVAAVSLAVREGEAWREVGRGTVFRLADGSGGERSSAALELAPNTARQWRIRFSDAAALGSGAPQLLVAWLPDRVRFAARGSAPYELVFGSAAATAAAAPLAQLATLAPQPAPATLGARTLAGGAQRLVPEHRPDWLRWVLWGTLGAAVLVLAAFARRLLKELGAESR